VTDAAKENQTEIWSALPLEAADPIDDAVAT
jgi:hypothetical protein